MRIAYLEDDPDQAALVEHWLKEGDHECFHFATGAALLASIAGLAPDLLVLDWQLPDMTGEAVMQAVRQGNMQQPPIVFLTAHSLTEDLVRVLRTGANDHILKPTKRVELLSRIAAFAPETRIEPAQEQFLYLKPYVIDRIARVITADDTAIKLNDAEFEVALRLFENLGHTITVQSLAEAVSRVSGEAVNIRETQAYVARARAKLRLSAANGWQLRTVTKVGYRLEALR